jgi:hypothetical protein
MIKHALTFRERDYLFMRGRKVEFTPFKKASAYAPGVMACIFGAGMVLKAIVALLVLGVHAMARLF